MERNHHTGPPPVAVRPLGREYNFFQHAWPWQCYQFMQGSALRKSLMGVRSTHEPGYYDTLKLAVQQGSRP